MATMECSHAQVGVILQAPGGLVLGQGAMGLELPSTHIRRGSTPEAAAQTALNNHGLVISGDFAPTNVTDIRAVHPCDEQSLPNYHDWTYFQAELDPGVTPADLTEADMVALDRGQLQELAVATRAFLRTLGERDSWAKNPGFSPPHLGLLMRYVQLVKNEDGEVTQRLRLVF